MLLIRLILDVQDVSSIVDLCRQSIVFEDLNDIAACLRVIGADSEVHMLRVKNRLDLKHRSSVSAGYRDVGMNLQIVSAETRTAGIDYHICELQLIYKPVAELKVLFYASGSYNYYYLIFLSIFEDTETVFKLNKKQT